MDSTPSRRTGSAARRRVAGLALAAAAAALAGCATFTAHSDFDPEADFTRLRTYAWVPRTLTDVPRDPRVDNALLDGRVRRAVDATLAQKGFVPAPEGAAPDFKLNYHIALEQRFDVQTIPSTYGYGLGWWGGPGYADVYVDQYEEGTLFLDVIDARRNALIWRGYTAGRVLPELSPEEREQRTLEAVQAILAKFPPPAGS